MRLDMLENVDLLHHDLTNNTTLSLHIFNFIAFETKKHQRALAVICQRTKWSCTRGHLLRMLSGNACNTIVPPQWRKALDGEVARLKPCREMNRYYRQQDCYILNCPREYSIFNWNQLDIMQTRTLAKNRLYHVLLYVQSIKTGFYFLWPQTTVSWSFTNTEPLRLDSDWYHLRLVLRWVLDPEQKNMQSEEICDPLKDS